MGSSFNEYQNPDGNATNSSPLCDDEAAAADLDDEDEDQAAFLDDDEDDEAAAAKDDEGPMRAFLSVCEVGEEHDALRFPPVCGVSVIPHGFRWVQCPRGSRRCPKPESHQRKGLCTQ
jgi:hypothetical protein